jgi:hypothetical protein
VGIRGLHKTKARDTMSFTFYIDELYNDFRINTGNMVLVSGADEVVQQIRSTLRTELGEWYLNILFGLPYYSSTSTLNDNSTPGILGGKMSAAEIEAYLLAAILQVPGVLNINNFSLVEVSDTRNLYANIEVTAETFTNNGLSTQAQKQIYIGLGG